MVLANDHVVESRKNLYAVDVLTAMKRSLDGRLGKRHDNDDSELFLDSASKRRCSSTRIKKRFCVLRTSRERVKLSQLIKVPAKVLPWSKVDDQIASEDATTKVSVNQVKYELI
ncbi:hypothetical protein H257_09940 [Aphanomyces astaci]|uniref:Uncharacterized protein n=1 Tax=Aphanomyces astaci TaxID=112090 RepID=W4G9N1_APHAT|nr:hypothetical protein H257_09940 [Aphanomyces astaci]ETV75986.1 hypothetical protein H257_09940 [Aphanomyces astaci]|eukprot:XP_009834628.1 hypothetical protein H257_09940 [Aphanomyces astaci]